MEEKVYILFGKLNKTSRRYEINFYEPIKVFKNESDAISYKNDLTIDCYIEEYYLE